MRTQSIYRTRTFAVKLFAPLLLVLGMLLTPQLMPPAGAATPDLPKELIQEAHGKMLLMDFYAPMCGTCRMMEPHLDALDKKTGDKLVIKRVDLSLPQNSHYLDLYNIKSTPNYILFNAEGKAVYRMENTISPAVLEKQVLRSVGQLQSIDFPAGVTLPAPQESAANRLQELLLVSFEKPDCKPCKTMSPYLDGYEMSEKSGFHVLHLDTTTESGRQLMEKLAIKNVPAYVLFDNNKPVVNAGSISSRAVPASASSEAQAGASIETDSAHAGINARGELFRQDGTIKPRALWEIVRLFAHTGV